MKLRRTLDAHLRFTSLRHGNTDAVSISTGERGITAIDFYEARHVRVTSPTFRRVSENWTVTIRGRNTVAADYFRGL